mmetsp:Transcript_38576/g.120038  ORF Transcript_38576/g.120038 Transcript_38576/m.120038 type:complete len:383 (+) Transcript_38576:103-1251(+)
MERDSDWIWEALALGEESLLKDADIDYFDWNGTHEKYGTPLIALVVGKATGQEVYDFATGTPEKLTERLCLMRLVLGKGASPHAKPPPQFSICKSWWKTEGDKEVENSRTPLVHFNDKSAYGVVASCLEALTNVEGDWKRELRFLRDAAKILASYRPSGHAGGGVPRVPVAEGVVETWESVLADAESADVAILVEGADDGAAAERVLVHSAVLRGASPVLRAMLATTGMREGARKVIEVKGCSLAALRLLLSLVYTGAVVGEEPSAAAMLVALDLAHRWQALHVVQMLAGALQRRLDADGLEPILDAALRFQLPSLLSACRAFISSHASELQMRLGKEALAAAAGPAAGCSAARAELLRVLGGARDGAQSAPSQRKQPRRVL